MTERDDPHAELHDMAGADSPQHEPVAGAAGETPDEKIDRINKELTKRINDLRVDNDKFKKATSSSVTALTGDVATIKTATENNKASIEAQDALIAAASKKAEDAKADAAAAATKADKAAADLAKLTGEVRTFEAKYESHTHDVEITMHGQTTGPKAAGGNA